MNQSKEKHKKNHNQNNFGEFLMPQSTRYLGKIGIIGIVVGLSILYYDAYRINQMFPVGYQIHEHPEIHIVIIGMVITFLGTGIFIVNFSKGRRVV